jgi:hypothetical protein
MMEGINNIPNGIIPSGITDIPERIIPKGIMNIPNGIEEETLIAVEFEAIEPTNTFAKFECFKCGKVIDYPDIRGCDDCRCNSFQLKFIEIQ